MSVLVDSSVWIDYFRDIGQAENLEFLIEENLVLTNDLILAELIPFLLFKKQKKLIQIFKEIKRQPIVIEWTNIIHMQTICLSKGINGVGIPDLIIAENAIQGECSLLSNDKHFLLIANHFPLKIFK
jgi:hypothetical protein